MCKTTSATAPISGAASSLTTTKRTVETLAPNEICIHGEVFNLDSFEHPGGDSINVFGGNDATVFYQMIHPHHGSQHYRKKMQKVGVIEGYQCEYTFESDFAQEMKREVFKIVKRGNEFGTTGYLCRAFGYILLFAALTYVWIVQGPSVGLAIVYGVSQAFIGLNVQHDANHGAASKKTWLNDLLGYGADFIGGCKWLWIEKHWTHHAYTNHVEKDPDAFAAEPFLIFQDYPKEHPVRRWYHPFQTLLFVPIIAGYWLSSVVSMEVAILEDAGAKRANMKFQNDFVKRQRKYAVLLRIIHLGVTFLPPFYHMGVTWEAFGVALLTGISGSIFLGCLFSLSHNFVNVDRDPTGEQTNGGKPVCWYKSQVETSCTYGGLVSGALTGGLNFQVEHHLFPRMSSAWYPFIAPTVRKICAKHNVRYTYYPWIWQNAISLMTYLHQTGNCATSKKDV